MNDLPKSYFYFLAALKATKQKKGSGFQNNLSITVEKSEAYISKIINHKSIASFNMQNSIAEACGYSYLDFLQFGQNLIENKQTDRKPPTPLKKSIENEDSTPSPQIGNVIRVYNNVIEKTGIKLDPKGQEILFNLIKKRLKEKASEAAEKEILDIISITSPRKQG